MSDETCNVLPGPPLDFCVQEASMGKYLFDCLKKRDPRHVTMVSAKGLATLVFCSQ